MNEQKEKLMSRGFMIIILAWTAAILAVFSFGMLLPDIMTDLNTGLTEAGNLSACSWIVEAIVTIPVALAVSRVNPKHILFVLYLCIGGGMLLQGFAQNYFMMMLGRALVACAFVPLVPVKINWIPKSKLAQTSRKITLSINTDPLLYRITLRKNRCRVCNGGFYHIGRKEEICDEDHKIPHPLSFLHKTCYSEP